VKSGGEGFCRKSFQWANEARRPDQFIPPVDRTAPLEMIRLEKQLALPDNVHDLNPGECHGGRSEGSEPEHRSRLSLNGSMILFDNVARWCMKNRSHAISPFVRGLLDTNGDRYAEAGHPIQDRASNFSFRLFLGRVRA
jgi:hypothetical protein